MSVVYVTSDWHLGHAKAYQWSGDYSSQEEREKAIIDNYLAVVRPRDIVWFLGDICLNRESLALVKKLPGDKRLVLGNHDTDSCGGKVEIEQQILVFDQVHSMVSYKGFWLTHCPIHELELRGKRNIHGHVHGSSITKPYGIEAMKFDPRYINACLEVNDFKPIKFQGIK